MKSIDEIPFVAFGNDELNKKDKIGNFEICPGCGKPHKVEYGNRLLGDGTRVPSKVLAFVTCPESKKSYLVGVRGKRV